MCKAWKGELKIETEQKYLCMENIHLLTEEQNSEINYKEW
jgi:hypothetical protein